MCSTISRSPAAPTPCSPMTRSALIHETSRGLPRQINNLAVAVADRRVRRKEGDRGRVRRTRRGRRDLRRMTLLAPRPAARPTISRPSAALPPPAGWPAPPDPAVYHELLGEIVTRIAPHTEADPVAILTQLLVAFGAAVGRGAWFTVEATRHHPNEFMLLVGDSSQGEEGVVMGSRPPADRRSRPVARAADPDRPVLRRGADLGRPRPDRARTPASPTSGCW